MASLLPILQEILPMLMPGSVHITKAEELRRPPGLPHHSEDEADPSDQAEEEEDDDDEDDDDDLALEDDRMTSFTDNASATAAWRSTFPRRSDRSERGQLSQLSLQPPSQTNQSNSHLQEPKRDTRRPRRTNSDPKPNSKPKQKKVRIANGVSLRDAIVHKSGSLCASILTVKPSCETVVFHNGEQEAIVYAVSGTAELATLPEDFDEYDSSLETQSHDASSLKSRPEPAKHTIGAGDFAFIPAWTEHQVRNVEEHEGAANVVWVVVRNASEPTVVPLEGWGGEAR